MTAKEIILKFPEKVIPEAIEGMKTVFHFDITGNGGGKITLQVADGVCTASEGLAGNPDCLISASDDDFKRVMKGELNPLAAMLSGRLKVSNQSEMLKYARIFGFM